MTLDKAELLIRRAFHREQDSAFIGAVKIQRLQTFCMDIMKTMQARGFLAMLFKCALFRALRPGVNKVLIGITYEMDGTTQSIAQFLLTRIGRPSRRKLATEVHNHGAEIHVTLISETEKIEFSEPCHCSSLVMVGKSSRFIAGAMRDGLPIDFENPYMRNVLALAADVIHVDIHSDLAKTNMPPIVHFLSLVDEMPNGLADHTCCEIHVANRIKASVKDLVTNVGKMYSLGREFKLASTVVEVVDNIEAVCMRIPNNNLWIVISACSLAFFWAFW